MVTSIGHCPYTGAPCSCGDAIDPKKCLQAGNAEPFLNFPEGLPKDPQFGWNGLEIATFIPTRESQERFAEKIRRENLHP